MLRLKAPPEAASQGEFEDSITYGREPMAASTLTFEQPLKLKTVGGLHCPQMELPCREQLSQ